MRFGFDHQHTPDECIARMVGRRGELILAVNLAIGYCRNHWQDNEELRDLHKKLMDILHQRKSKLTT